MFLFRLFDLGEIYGRRCKKGMNVKEKGLDLIKKN